MNNREMHQANELLNASHRDFDAGGARASGNRRDQSLLKPLAVPIEAHLADVSAERALAWGLHPRRRAKRIHPIALMVEGRECLVIGGGNVAARKVQALLEAGARVTVVAPEIGERLRALHSVTGLTIVRRKYVPEDLHRNLLLVIAATDDPALNQAIIEACRSRGILSTCPDKGWESGDFISLASFKHGDLTISVSTGGVSSRRSRLIRDNLAKHVEALERSDLLVLGTDHRFANLEERESLHFSDDRLKQTAGMLGQILGLHEFMLLQTCNRVELVGIAATAPSVVGAVSRILGFDRIADRFYTHWGFNAFRHLVFVAAGLLSQTPRETHIRAQIKEAMDRSRREGWSGRIIHDWVGRALRLSREIRDQTGEILGKREIEDRCVSFLANALGGLRGRRILVIGSGTVGKKVIEALLTNGASVACCYHTHTPEWGRSSDREVALWHMADLRKALLEQEAVVCALSGEEPALKKEHASLLSEDRTLLLVDLGVPRNVSPDFSAGRKHIRVVNLDDLHQWYQHSVECVQRALEIGNRVVNEHVEEYERVVLGVQAGH